VIGVIPHDISPDNGKMWLMQVTERRELHLRYFNSSNQIGGEDMS
jgi:hypothetical protein